MPMNAASLSRSPRLKRVLAVLKRGGWWSTRELLGEAEVCAVNSCVAELRANGIQIECVRRGVREQSLFFYRLADGGSKDE